MNPLAYLDTAISLGFVHPGLRESWLTRTRDNPEADDIRALLKQVGVISADQDAAILAAMPEPAATTASDRDETVEAAKQRDFQPASNEDSQTILRVAHGRSIGARSGNEPAVDLRGRDIEAHDDGPKYQRGKLLGRGGMGEVSLAVDRDLRREVAIKTLLQPDREMVRQRFIEEAQVTGQLEHPNIVPIHELGMDDDERPFLVMKRVRGRSLADVIEAVRVGDTVLLRNVTSGSRARSSALRPSGETDRGRGRARPSSRLARSSGRLRGARAGLASHDVPVDTGDIDAPTMLTQLLGMFLKICDALAYAHSRGVIHRDLKPENVMVGEFGEVLVMDWGLAKVLTRDSSAPDAMVSTLRSSGLDSGAPIARTVDGAVAGTPAYMPPEQARGEIDRLDARSDVYALGAMLYEMVTCNVPIEAPSVYTLLARVANGEIDPPSARNRAPWSVPRELEAVVMKAMAREQRDRYADATMLKADVEAYLSGRTTQAAEYSPWEVLAKWAKRNKIAVIGAAATLLALVGGIVAAVVLRVDAELTAERERIATEQRTRETAEQEARETAQAEARSHYETGDAAFAEAATIPFNPAAPQEYFQATLPAWMQMGAAYQAYPEGAPADWRDALTRRGDDLFDKATQVGDWALASVIVEAARQWRAIDVAERADKLEQIDTLQRERAAVDRDRLDKTLDLIARADVGENRGGRIPPGEVTERARKIARLSGPALLQDVIGMLADETYPMDSFRRRFLIETLGWYGDVHVEYDGLNAPKLIKREITKLSAETAYHDEATIWAWAAARLVMSDALTFDELGDVIGGMDIDAAGAVGLVELQRIVDTLEIVLGMKTFDGSDTDRVDEIVEAVTFVTVSRAQSGADFTRYLLDLAQNGDHLTPRQLACVYDFMGAHGDREPPDPLESDASAVTVLLDAFNDLPDDLWLANAPAREMDAARWARVRAKMLATPINLWRLDELSIASELDRRRGASGQFSVYSRMTDLAFTLMPESGDQPETAVEFERRAMARYKRFNYVGALDDLDRAIELDPESSSAYGNRATIRQQMEDYTGALEDYSKAIELSPEAIEPLINRGNFLLSAGNFDEAMRDFNAALEIDPLSAVGLDSRGEAWRTVGELQRAFDDLNRALEIAPTFANAYYHRGAVLSAAGRHADALRDMNQAIDLAPNRPNYYIGRGLVKSGLRNYEGALADYNRALEMDPGNIFAHVNRATARVAMQDFEGALRDYDTVLRVRPNDHQSLGNKAMTLAMMGRKDEAGPLFERAIQLAPPQARERLEAARDHFMNR